VSEEALDAMLEKLAGGDDAAVEQVFRAYEPVLRNVVRRHLGQRLRAKFDSADVVQSVWADLLRGFREGAWAFTDRERLKAFLVTATRHRLVDRARGQRLALRHEQAPGGRQPDPAAVPCAQPLPSQIAQAEDLWQRMLAECQPAQREVLELKRQGLSAAEIARRTGLHEGSIHRLLRNLLSRLAVSR
jgi:RNA polymerase sigma-70 factor (ECF subfamily)